MSTFELERLKQFKLTRVLSDGTGYRSIAVNQSLLIIVSYALHVDPILKSISLLGTIAAPDPGDEPLQTIITLQKKAFDPLHASAIVPSLAKSQVIEINDIVSSSHIVEA